MEEKNIDIILSISGTSLFEGKMYWFMVTLLQLCPMKH